MDKSKLPFKIFLVAFRVVFWLLFRKWLSFSSSSEEQEIRHLGEQLENGPSALGFYTPFLLICRVPKKILTSTELARMGF